MADRDEQISAYLDGVMPAAEAARFEAAMAQDPILRDEVEVFRNADEMLRAAFPADADNIDAAMIARLGLETRPALPKTAANDNPARFWKIGLAGGAIAASIAVALILTPSGGGSLERDSQFQLAMESAPSGKTLPLSQEGRMVRPVLTFAAADGRFCREFAVDNQSSGIACRSKGKWTIEAEASASSADLDNGDVRTAAGADLAPLEQNYKRLQASDPFSMEKENTIISDGWE